MLPTLFPFLLESGLYFYESDATLPKEAQRPEASWRTMFFTQPPIKMLAVEYDCAEDDDDGSSRADWAMTPVRAPGTKVSL
jgi:hypothetical protein